MTPTRKVAAFRLDEDLIQGLQLVYERDGVQPAEQVRRAVRQWLEARGAIEKAERKRAPTRKRS